MLHADGMRQYRGKKLENHYKIIPYRIRYFNGTDSATTLLYYLETENKAFMVRGGAVTEWIFTRAYVKRNQLPKVYKEEEWEVCYKLNERNVN